MTLGIKSDFASIFRYPYPLQVSGSGRGNHIKSMLKIISR